MANEEIALAVLAKALARLRILRLLPASPGCIGGHIVDAVRLAQSKVSEHLRVLARAGTVPGRTDGPRVRHALNPAVLAPLAAFIASMTPPSGDACCVPGQKETA